MKKLRLIFFGSSHHSLPALKALFKEKDYEVVAIVSQPDRPVGRKQVLIPTPVSQFARQKMIPLFTPQSQQKKSWLYKNPKKLAHQLAKLAPDLLISAYYGQKIPQKILKLAPFGGLNLHPSLLPKYRGPAPAQWAIYNGEKMTGITILKIAEEFDQGKIVAQEKIKILPTDTSETLYARLFQRGAKLLIEILSDYIQGKIKLTKQDKSQASYYPRLTREAGKIDWSKTPEETERMIRAFHPWPGTWAFVSIPDGNLKPIRDRTPLKRLKILKAHLKKLHATRYTLHATRLVLDLVQLEGKKPVSFKQFKSAYPNFQFLS